MIPDRIRTLGDFERLLAATTNYEEKLPTDASSRAFDLGRMRRLLASVGDPQLGPRTAHVTGSKGKGSTCRMLASVLRAADLGPVGLYVSPHLERLTERVSVDGRPVEDAILAAAADELLPHLRRTWGGPDAPTFFEVLTAAAHLAFRALGVRQCVLEVGLGGRLDATNVCRPSVTAITTIELEHTKLLGDRLEQIAEEKAGILKPGVPCVTAVPQDSPARGVIEASAARVGAPLYRLGAEVEVSEVVAGPGPRLDLAVTGPAGRPRRRLALRVAGVHQAGNAAVAAALARLLDVPEAAIARGLADVTLPGRLECVRERPFVVLDGAHTAASARAACEGVATGFPHARLHLVVGVLEEKDVAGILAPLLARASSVVACRVASPRSLPAERLAAIARAGTSVPVAVAADAAAGLDAALARAEERDLVLVTGSLYLAGAARAAARGRPGFHVTDG